jgi:hypothetical protein
MNEALINSVVRSVANIRNVESNSVKSYDRLMEIIGHICQDKMADLSASVQIAELALLILDAEIEQTKRSEEIRLAGIKLYWDKKLEEFSKQ